LARTSILAIGYSMLLRTAGKRPIAELGS
jgi:hypothetical protein